MYDDVPNLRGGIPHWLYWLGGIVVTVGVAAAPAIVSIVRTPSAERFDLLRDRMEEISRKIAVMERAQIDKAEADELRTKLLDQKLDTVIAGQRKRQ